MTKLLLPQKTLDDARLMHGFFDDFHAFLTAQSGAAYTVTTAVDGTVLVNDAAGGTVTIASATATVGDNEDTYLNREPEGFLPAAGKPLYFEAAVKYSEVSTNTPNVIVGLTDAVAANLLVDNGAGPKTSGTTLAFYKVDGGLNWNVHVSLSTTQTSVQLTAANSLDKSAHLGASTTFQRLGILFLPRTAALADVSFFIDGTLVYKVSDWTFTSATEIQAVAGVKNGTTTACSLTMDYWGCYQLR
jgi:hypothetical protein